MDRGEVEDELEIEKGIVLMLLRLAVLAEFICLLPSPARFLALWLLRPAEAVARAFAMEQAGGAVALPPAVVPAANGGGYAEAMRLARCFRALAFFFCGLRGFDGGPFRAGPDRRLLQRAPATAWRGQTMTTQLAMAANGAEHIDTS